MSEGKEVKVALETFDIWLKGMVFFLA